MPLHQEIGGAPDVDVGPDCDGRCSSASVESIFFALAVNIKTATALDLKVPDSLLARADEVIE